MKAVLISLIASGAGWHSSVTVEQILGAAARSCCVVISGMVVLGLKALGAGAPRADERIMANRRRREGMLNSIFLLCLWGAGHFGGGCAVCK